MTNQSSLLLKQVDDLLPQTQCTQCGFQGCLPYAKAIVNQHEKLNRCPPGGQQTIKALSQLLGRPEEPLDPNCGVTIERHIASIEPEHCIGCTLCIKACPVDAIIGTNKTRHAVIADLCTGCELCIPPCPVDCIDMVFLPEYSHWSTQQAHEARDRMHQREARLERQQQETNRRLEQKATEKLTSLDGSPETATYSTDKKSVIQAAIERARLKRQQAV